MHKHFLCPKHRQWLQQNPQAAKHHLSDTQETAQYYRDRGRWLDALPYLGCAYETAELVLANLGGDKNTVVINFTSAAILLADTYHKVLMEEKSIEIYDLAQRRLQAEFFLCYQDTALQVCIKDCIKALHKGAGIQQYIAGIDPQPEAMSLFH